MTQLCIQIIINSYILLVIFLQYSCQALYNETITLKITNSSDHLP